MNKSYVKSVYMLSNYAKHDTPSLYTTEYEFWFSSGHKGSGVVKLRSCWQVAIYLHDLS